MSKKVDRVELESTTFYFPCLRSYQLSYRSENGTEAFEIVYTVYTVPITRRVVHILLYVYQYVIG